MDPAPHTLLAEVARAGPDRPPVRSTAAGRPRRPLVAPALACLSAALLGPLVPELLRRHAALGAAITASLLLVLGLTRGLRASAGERSVPLTLGLCAALAMLTLSRLPPPSEARPAPGLHRIEGRVDAARLDSRARLRARLSELRLDGRPVADRCELIWTDPAAPAAEAEARHITGTITARAFRGRLWLFADGAALRLSERELEAPSRLLLAMRRRVASAIGPAAAGSDRALLHSLLLGRRDRLDHGTRELFRRTGTAHVLAVSGLHVGLVALFGFALASACGAGRRLRAGFAGALILLYLALVGPRPSAIRAAVLAFGLLLAGLTERRRDAWNLLALAALGLILLDPGAPFDIGCQLSFLTTAGLIAAAPRVLHLTGGDEDRTEARGGALERSGRWRRLLRPVALSAVAITVSLPITISVFGLVAPAGLIANAFAVPVCLLLLASGLLAVLVAIIHPGLGAVVMTAPRVLARLLIAGLGLFDQPLLAPIEISTLDPIRSPLWWALLCGLGLAVGLILRLLQRRGLGSSRARRWGPGLAIGLGALGVLRATRADPGVPVDDALRRSPPRLGSALSRATLSHSDRAIWVGAHGEVAWRREGARIRRRLRLPGHGRTRRYGRLILTRPDADRVELRLDPGGLPRLILILDAPLVPLVSPDGPDDAEAEHRRVLRIERPSGPDGSSGAPLFPASLRPGQAWRVPLAAPRDAESQPASVAAIRP